MRASTSRQADRYIDILIVFGVYGGGVEGKEEREHGSRLQITWTHAYVWSKIKKNTGTII